ncbi:hypothetical protein [Legionella brunensis]|uniref:Uncharacterized protein n=1 Tax=Legionella brunensis TaxID=29422 RepID=A0A0W0STI4_9GAMM|nr:hypothetical protein [Legionella brunensis]KTC86593.1 hypothetical protein Lbru_0534 [Legionella brunensis]
MSASLEEITKMTSDSLHNKNCFSYLKNLQFSESVLQRLPASLANNFRTDSYNPGYAYADVYTDFFSKVESNIEKIYDKPKQEFVLKKAQLEQINTSSKQTIPGMETFILRYKQSLEKSLAELKELDNFIFSIYDNDNDILEDTFDVIKNIPLNHAPVNVDIEQSISSALKDKGPRINRTQSPSEAGSLFGRFTAMIADDFKPQHTTSLATVRKYNYTQAHSDAEHLPREYRFGTQAQRDKGIERTSPLFERWLQVQAEKAAEKTRSSKKITHIYFNNLGLDRTDAEGKKERALTQELHQLEKYPNVAVITLPADKGLMTGDRYRKTKDSHSYAQVYEEFLGIANQDPHATNKIKDFFISDKIRHLIFQDPAGDYTNEEERTQLSQLLDKSFHVMGILPGTPISSAQKQAVWFHFIKFELTNHIIQKLEPESINFSCKDAIDRGGVSSAYYNLIKSFERNTLDKNNIPMDREEFERALHAAPAMVKARGMNHHLKVIWNAVDAYVNANYDKLKNNEMKNWLIEWRDINCPHSRVNDLLAQRIEQSIQELKNAKDAYPESMPMMKPPSIKAYKSWSKLNYNKI